MKRPLKTFKPAILATALMITLLGCSSPQAKRDILFQTSTIDALLVGVYDGEMTFKELKQHGDLGLGTFNGLDGEMIALDGQFYQIKMDGVAYPVADSMKTPFSVVTFFEADDARQLNNKVNYEQLTQYLDSVIPTENIFYAIRIDGVFSYIKTRSVPEQHKPYPPLVDVVKHQAVFEFHDTEGTILGFRTPGYVKGINVPGYHLHFITADKKAGGHLLACEMEDVKIELDSTSMFTLVLPEDKDFARADLAKERHKELQKVEKQ
jgi:acetolactate decarboxylase